MTVSDIGSANTREPDVAGRPVQVHRVHIKAPQERVWAAITTPEWAVQYGYQSPVELDLRPGGAYRALPTAAMVEFGAPADQPILDGEILEVDPPNRLVQTFRTLWDEEARAEGFTRLTYELVALRNGITRLTITHELAGAPRSAGLFAGDIEPFGGGWPEILSDLKTLLETGRSMHSPE